MNKLLLILLVFLFSCDSMEKYNEKTNNYMEAISTDSLIQQSRANIKRIFTKNNDEHHHSDSLHTCLDSILHELEIEKMKLEELQSQSYQEVMMTESYEMVEPVSTPMVTVGYGPDTLFIHDTIYIDSFKTVKETIIEFELMTEKDKANLKKKRAKNKDRKPKFK